MSTISTTRRSFLMMSAAAPLAASMPNVSKASALTAEPPSPKPAPAWGWWAGSDEERFSLGPFASRTEMLEAAKEEWFGEGFFVLEALPGTPLLRPAGDRILELLDEMNEDRVDPDGDGTIFTYDKQLTPEVVADLELAVGDAIDAWTRRHGITAQVFMFNATRSFETIEAEVCADEQTVEAL